MKISKPNFSQNRNFKFGTVATALTVGFIAVVVVINIIATILLEKFPLTIDLTSSGRYDISQESIDYVSGIDKEVDIYVLADESYFNDPVNTYFYQLGETMKKYTQYNSRITLNYIDLESNPGFAQNYKNETFAIGDILVQSDLRYQKFSYNDMLHYAYDSQGRVTSISSKAEETLTSSLLYVTDENPISVAFVSNHGTGGVDGLISLLQGNSFEISSFDLLSQEIPDAQIVVIAAPMQDFDKLEIDKLTEFMLNGGDFGKQMLYIANPDQPELPNLEDFLAEWGVGFEDGVAYETDENLIYYNNYFSIQDDESVNLKFAGREEPLSAPILMYGVRPLVALFDAQNLRSTTVLATTHESAVLAPFDPDENWDPADEQNKAFTTIIAAQRKSDAEVGKDITTSTLLVFGSSEMFTSGIGDSDSFGNAQYTVSLLNELTGREDSQITVTSKELTPVVLEINATTAIFLGILFVAILPLAVLVAGLVVFLRRRNL